MTGHEGVGPEEFREALSYWASGVTIAAVRDGSEVQATTVGSLTSVSDTPATVLISLTGSARILPFLGVGTALGISVLGRHQARTAAVYADSYPVGPSPFLEEGAAPLVEGAMVHLRCRVERVMPIGGSHVVEARVMATALGESDDPLLYFRREFRELS